MLCNNVNNGKRIKKLSVNSRLIAASGAVRAILLTGLSHHLINLSFLFSTKLLDTSVPFFIVLLVNYGNKSCESILDVSCNAQIRSNILAYLSPVYVYVNYLEILSKSVLVSGRSVAESCAAGNNKISLILSNGGSEMSVHTLHSEKMLIICRNSRKSHKRASDRCVDLIGKSHYLLRSLA